jgi:hypothetical protein
VRRRRLLTAHESLPILFFPAFERPTPLLPITSLQPQQFHAITHSFAQPPSAIPPVLNGFRTLSIATGVYPKAFPTTDFQASNVSTLLFTKAWRLFVLSLRLYLHSFLLFSNGCSLFSEITRVGGIDPPSKRQWGIKR